MELYGSSAWVSRSARRHARAHRALDVGLGERLGHDLKPKERVTNRQLNRLKSTASIAQEAWSRLGIFDGEAHGQVGVGPNEPKGGRDRTFLAPGVVLAVLVILVGACTGSGTEVSLVAGESSEDADALGYAFADEDIIQGAPTITVQAGEEVTLTLENVHGQYFGGAGHSHDLAIVPATDENRENPRVGPAFSEKVLWDVWLGGEMAIFSGDAETITFVPDEPGEYVYVCTIRDHAERGMLGEFIVESG